ncbi:MAG: electron transport complex subunit RsxB [Betaproteobacteria bacterium]|nr:electron transport complex subunit RsxB [Betaproteobacteria bacterium]
MLVAISVMALGALVLGSAIGYAAIRFKVEGDPVVEKINAILPQTQCGQCSYPGCKPYAEAIARGEAEINLCPPGGDEGVHQLSELLGREYKPLAEESQTEKKASVALIDEADCIGCTLCIQACPVDAILGAAKQMHTVIIPLCTGCELCIAPCPVDCIAMKPLPETPENWEWPYPQIDKSPDAATHAPMPTAAADIQ